MLLQVRFFLILQTLTSYHMPELIPESIIQSLECTLVPLTPSKIHAASVYM